MKILITGITGLLGSYMARYFSGKAEIFGLKRPGSNVDLLGELSEKIHWFEGDINDFQLMEDACSGMDFVIHAAGLVSFENSGKEELLKTNTYGTTNIVNAMLSIGGGKLVFISSVAALGREAGHLVINEDFKWSNSELNSPYAISKHLAELEVWRGAQEGLQVMVFNPSVLLGKISDRRSSSEIYQFVLQGSNYYPLGNINYIDIRDAVEIMGPLIELGKWNERYIISKESLPYKVFFSLMAEILGIPPPKKPLSGRVAYLALAWASVRNLFSREKLPLNRQKLMLAQMKIAYDNSKIQSLLSHRFIPLKETFHWAKQPA
ncbi:MAG: NAD-dependent epimerase/dehydratase family protein [Cyclobacteriaceae bacterium]